MLFSFFILALSPWKALSLDQLGTDMVMLHVDYLTCGIAREFLLPKAQTSLCLAAACANGIHKGFS